MNFDLILKEIELEATKSSGAGGQHVNKVSTKIQLKWHIDASKALTNEQKETLKNVAKNHLNEAGFLRLSSSNSRSQFQNKKLAVNKLLTLLTKAFLPKKKKNCYTST